EKRQPCNVWWLCWTARVMPTVVPTTTAAMAALESATCPVVHDVAPEHASATLSAAAVMPRRRPTRDEDVSGAAERPKAGVFNRLSPCQKGKGSGRGTKSTRDI